MSFLLVSLHATGHWFFDHISGDDLVLPIGV